MIPSARLMALAAGLAWGGLLTGGDRSRLGGRSAGFLYGLNDEPDAIEVLIVTGVTNARTEAANTSIKQLKRTGRGYRNPAHYRARILLASAARSAA